jgi:hypothetical protein
MFQMWKEIFLNLRECASAREIELKASNVWRRKKALGKVW